MALFRFKSTPIVLPYNKGATTTVTLKYGTEGISEGNCEGEVKGAKVGNVVVEVIVGAI